MTESSPLAGMTAVAPSKPAAPYIGGKKRLGGQLTELIGAIPHVTYAEAFVGMGGVFFRRKSKPKAEVINDCRRRCTISSGSCKSTMSRSLK